MKLHSVYARFFRSLNYDFIRASGDNYHPDPWDATADGDYPFVRIKLRPGITTVVGANESGKTQVLKAIERALTGEDIVRSDFCRYSRFFGVDESLVQPEFGAVFTDISPADIEVIESMSGGVGLAAIAAAKASGATRILALDLNPEKLEEAKAFGATEVHVPGQGDLPTGFDTVIDAVGGAATLRTAISLAGSGARVILSGAPTQTEVADFGMREVFLKRLRIEYSHWGDSVPERDLAKIVAEVENGAFPIERYVSEVVPLEDCAAAYDRLRDGSVLRSVIEISGEDRVRASA